MFALRAWLQSASTVSVFLARVVFLQDERLACSSSDDCGCYALPLQLGHAGEFPSSPLRNSGHPVLGVYVVLGLSNLHLGGLVQYPSLDCDDLSVGIRCMRLQSNVNP